MKPRIHTPPALVLVAALALFAACRTGPEQWGPFRGQVVDQQSGKPLSGAHVLIAWRQSIPNPVQGSERFFDARETAADSDGRFEIPRLARIDTALVGEPGFYVFVAGYAFGDIDITPANGRRFVDPTVIKMRRVKHDERCSYLNTPNAPPVPHNKAPKFIDAVHRYGAALGC